MSDRFTANRGGWKKALKNMKKKHKAEKSAKNRFSKQRGVLKADMLILLAVIIICVMILIIQAIRSGSSGSGSSLSADAVDYLSTQISTKICRTL